MVTSGSSNVVCVSHVSVIIIGLILPTQCHQYNNILFVRAAQENTHFVQTPRRQQEIADPRNQFNYTEESSREESEAFRWAHYWWDGHFINFSSCTGDRFVRTMTCIMFDSRSHNWVTNRIIFPHFSSIFRRQPPPPPPPYKDQQGPGRNSSPHDGDGRDGGEERDQERCPI